MKVVLTKDNLARRGWKREQRCVFCGQNENIDHLFFSCSAARLLWNLIKDVEPLDLSVVQRDVPPETVDAMKRNVSGILGLLQSNQ